MVGAAERKKRNRAADLFVGWLLLATTLALPQLALLPNSSGLILSEFGRALFSAGGPQYLLTEAILFVGDEFLYMRVNLKASWDTARQWQRREPGELTAPCPRSIALAVAALALLWSWPKVVEYVLLFFYGILRGIEGRLLRRCDISLPSQRNGRRPGRVYVRIIDPKMKRRGSEVEHVAIGSLWLVVPLEYLLKDMLPGEVIFPWERDALKRRWDRLLTTLGVPLGRLHLNSLRGGGCCDLFEDTEDLQTTLWKGRWSGDMKVLGHYLQQALADFPESE